MSADDPATVADGPTTLVVACAALTRELRVVLAQVGSVESVGSVAVTYLPAPLHNRPERIPAAIAAAIGEAGSSVERIVVAYADCGTGGLLDAELDRLRASTGVSITRLPGPHCYEFFAGASLFASLADEEPGTFYLTDYLAKHFDALVWSGLGLDRHPSLRDAYFGNYTRVVLLSQTADDSLADVKAAARAAAERLGLRFEHREVGMAPFTEAVRAALGSPVAPTHPTEDPT